MATLLDKTLRRQVTVDGVEYTLAVDPDGMRLTGKGRRKPEVDLRWRDLISGDAALTQALNASLAKSPAAAPSPPAATPVAAPSPPAPASERATRPAARKRAS